MKILEITPSISRNSGGVGPVVRTLSEEFVRNGIGVRILSLWNECVKDDCKGRDFDFDAYPVQGPRCWGYSRELKKALLQSQGDVFHVHGIWMNTSVTAGAIARKRNIPYVISPHGMLDPWALKISGWKKKIAGRLFEDRNLSSASCIHTLCDSEYESVRKYGLRNPVAVIPNGIDLPKIKGSLSSPWRDYFSEDKKVILFLGRIHPKKGLLNLIKAWANLKPEGWALVIAGWSQGGHENELKQFVSLFGLEHDILFLGSVFDEKKQACLQNADAFVLPSYSEGLPMSVLEAWSYELPVVMTAQCNIPIGFTSNAAIEVCPDIKSISDGLTCLFCMSDDQLRNIGLIGKKLVQERFMWSRIASDMVDVYKWVLGHGDRPECVRMD